MHDQQEHDSGKREKISDTGIQLECEVRSSEQASGWCSSRSVPLREEAVLKLDTTAVGRVCLAENIC
jgi:hypothetical protein